MDLSKLTYSKRGPGRSFATPVHNPTTERKEEKATFEIPGVSPAYQKPEGILSTSLVFVVSGGEKKEKDFLRELIMQRELHSLRIAFMSEKGQGLQPYQMHEKWEKIQSSGTVKINAQLFHLDVLDKVFLLSDVDEFYDQLEKIFKNNSNGTRGKWIVSNPSFEIWLYYCYLNNPEKDLEILKSEPASSRSQKLKTLGNTLVKGGLNPHLAFELMGTGIKHSKAHYDADDNGIPVLYATQMHKMAQYLVDTMNQNADEYSEYVRRKKDRSVLMRKQSPKLNQGKLK